MTPGQLFLVIALLAGAIVLLGSPFSMAQPFMTGSEADGRAGFRRGQPVRDRGMLAPWWSFPGPVRSCSRNMTTASLASLPYGPAASEARGLPRRTGQELALRREYIGSGADAMRTCFSSTISMQADAHAFQERGHRPLCGLRVSEFCSQSPISSRVPRDQHRLRIATGRLSGSRPSAAQRAGACFGPGLMLRDLLGVPGPLGLDLA